MKLKELLELIFSYSRIEIYILDDVLADKNEEWYYFYYHGTKGGFKKFLAGTNKTLDNFIVWHLEADAFEQKIFVKLDNLINFQRLEKPKIRFYKES